jgi:hypothetical protein
MLSGSVGLFVENSGFVKTTKHDGEKSIRYKLFSHKRNIQEI